MCIVHGMCTHMCACVCVGGSSLVNAVSMGKQEEIFYMDKLENGYFMPHIQNLHL